VLSRHISAVARWIASSVPIFGWHRLSGTIQNHRVDVDKFQRIRDTNLLHDQYDDQI